jgi:hypothetical protein
VAPPPQLGRSRGHRTPGHLPRAPPVGCDRWGPRDRGRAKLDAADEARRFGAFVGIDQRPAEPPLFRAKPTESRVASGEFSIVLGDLRGENPNVAWPRRGGQRKAEAGVLRASVK